MAFRITYVDEANFISYNPWFTLALEDRIGRIYDSDRLRHKIRNEINDQFPGLWRSHVNSDTEYRMFLNKISTASDAGVTRVNQTVDIGTARVQQATEMKVSELMNSGSLEPLKSSILNTAMSKYAGFESTLSSQFNTNERLRNERLAQAEKEINDLRSSQVWTVLGSMVLGVGLGIFGMRHR